MAWYEDDLKLDAMFKTLSLHDVRCERFDYKLMAEKYHPVVRAYRLCTKGTARTIEIIFWVKDKVIKLHLTAESLGGPVELSYPFSRRAVAMGFIEGYITAVQHLV